MTPHERPINDLPVVIVGLCLIAVAVELMLSAASAGVLGGPGGIGWRVQFVQEFSFVPGVIDAMKAGDYGLGLLRRFVTYAFIHDGMTHMLFAGALLLALGKFVGDVFSTVNTLILFLITTVFGALIYGTLVTNNYPLMGLYPPVYGFIGAYTYIVWVRLGVMGESQIKAFQLIGFLLGLQLVFGLLFGSNPTWIAELSAFFVGFAASTVLAPGGWAAFLAKMRRD